MEVRRFDISQVEGWPFEATPEAKEEYGGPAAHPILDRYFDAGAPVRWFYWRKFSIIARLLAAHGGEGGTALVAGCGPGVELPTLSTGFDKVIAMDINGADLDIARAICRSQDVGNVDFVRADLTRDPLEPGSVDMVFMIDVLEHFADAGAAVAVVHGLLREGGRFLVVAPTENRFNDGLRRALGYSKPATHYHTSAQLERVIGRRFRLLERARPLGLPRFLSLAEIFLFGR